MPATPMTESLPHLERPSRQVPTAGAWAHTGPPSDVGGARPALDVEAGRGNDATAAAGGTLIRPAKPGGGFHLAPAPGSGRVPQVQQVTVQQSDLFEQLDMNQDHVLQDAEIQKVRAGAT